MTHNEKRTSWRKEGIIGALFGFNYGIVCVAIGHPFDTLKTKLQAQDSFIGLSMRSSIKKIYSTNGIKGFYKGGTSIVLGSALFRSTQFLVFETIHSRFDDRNLIGKPYEMIFRYKIPFMLGLEVRTLVAGLMSGICRSIVECPFELYKVKKQVDQSFTLKNMFHGIKPLMLKNSLITTLSFCIIDIFRRNTRAWESSSKLFLVSGICTLACHALCWPAEVFKNFYMTRNNEQIDSTKRMIKEYTHNYTSGILQSAFRGILPGMMSTFLRNGIALVMLIKMQKLMTRLGLRD